MTNNTWESIFARSPVDCGHYEVSDLPQYNWDWPTGTWFQARRDQVREGLAAWRHNAKKLRSGVEKQAP